jgi:hypothetical protein
MKQITPNTYKRIAQLLLDDNKGNLRWEGKIDTDEGVFTATLFFYLSHDRFNDRTVIIKDVVPIWWEFHTYDDEGDEVINDFSFAEFKLYLI